ncbi:allophanate hydrolase subunit 2 [Campylobacter sputorum subsp. bubulus]|uniref:Allophanate hydrolase subunit 2 n=1 Tax=Campylobacter sputorum subsp. sputorum TaxID=32024 RepID=A0A381DHN6_9BACT|nr:biotin-dependent carboxyltransferase family protein [Campylobacter sputorum]ASM35252.1 allophanate hydrolase, subunit 2 [Campylobacter sputorum aubsp. sputorum RM3237]QEL05443.1 allophanate hydrolase, subunit 2 [Campylobacter sputorum subsp. sputorum]SUX08741.1 allophanate hydrolase subunit 2 [Campylobacter sputorum subsp. bubulus]SUX10176.1 allophanate hydrolase subunit 2 [Campylobacter sputorum subsp. sputorum]
MIRIKNAGLLSSIQDFGRIGFKKFGMPTAGVMDKFAYVVSQFLVQNDEFDGVIETTIVGVEIEFFEDMIICVTGAQNELFINGDKKELWKAHLVNQGDVLLLKNATNGARNYIAFSKKMSLKKINSSLSTYLKSNIGGFHGRALQNDDEIEFEQNYKIYKPINLPKNFIPLYKQKESIKVVLGPEKDAFSDKGIYTFLNSTYNITQSCDRMGYRLSGEKIEHKNGADIISNAVFFGSIQVPNSGEPIILMADAQTTGGYTKIATILPSELPKVGQLKGGDKISFVEVSNEEAQDIEIKYQKYIYELQQILKKQISIYDIKVNGVSYNVVVEDKNSCKFQKL